MQKKKKKKKPEEKNYYLGTADGIDRSVYRVIVFYE
jgi:hypothetical protein